MSEQQSSWTPVVVSVVGVVGSIGVALITTRSAFDREFENLKETVTTMTSSVSAANEQLTQVQRETSTLRALIADGQRQRTSCTSRLWEARDMSALSVQPTGGDGAQWADFPTMRVQIQLDEPRNIAAFYQLSDVVLAVPGATIVSRLNIDNSNVLGNPVITGQEERYRTATSFWFGELGAGSHTVKVEYRSGATGSSDPLNNNAAGRVLYVFELCPEPN